MTAKAVNKNLFTFCYNGNKEFAAELIDILIEQYTLIVDNGSLWYLIDKGELLFASNFPITIKNSNNIYLYNGLDS